MVNSGSKANKCNLFVFVRLWQIICQLCHIHHIEQIEFLLMPSDVGIYQTIRWKQIEQHDK